jgi:hypothetical protein
MDYLKLVNPYIMEYLQMYRIHSVLCIKLANAPHDFLQIDPDSLSIPQPLELVPMESVIESFDCSAPGNITVHLPILFPIDQQFE